MGQEEVVEELERLWREFSALSMPRHVLRRMAAFIGSREVRWLSGQFYDELRPPMHPERPDHYQSGNLVLYTDNVLVLSKYHYTRDRGETEGVITDGGMTEVHVVARSAIKRLQLVQAEEVGTNDANVWWGWPGRETSPWPLNAPVCATYGSTTVGLTLDENSTPEVRARFRSLVDSLVEDLSRGDSKAQ